MIRPLEMLVHEWGHDPLPEADRRALPAREPPAPP